MSGLIVLVVASLLSAAFEAIQIEFNLQLWVLILLAIAIAVSGYVTFEMALGYMASSEDREKEWLCRKWGGRGGAAEARCDGAAVIQLCVSR